MSDVSLEPTAPAPSPRAAQIDVAELDDKHLAQYRHPRERGALIIIVVGAIALVIGLWLLQEHVGNLLTFLPGRLIEEIVKWFHPTRSGPVLLTLLLAVWAMDIVGQSSKAWQLVARAVEVTPKTFPQLAPIADELRGRFDLPRTRVYVSRDAPPAGYTIGVREPFAIVMSAVTVGSMTPDELKFMLGREMGHIKLGHTLPSTVLGSAQPGLPMPFSYLLKIRGVLFGAYQHAQELSCDRIGVVATRDVRPALTMLIKQNLGTVRGAKIDLESMAAQRATLNTGVTGATLRMTQMLSSQPFALARLHELVTWAGEPKETPVDDSPARSAETGATPAAGATPVPTATSTPAAAATATVADGAPDPAPSTAGSDGAAEPAPSVASVPAGSDTATVPPTVPEVGPVGASAAPPPRLEGREGGGADPTGSQAS